MTQPDILLMIRHGEKPDKHDSAVDQHGHTNGDGLIPKGWARAGALATLFDANGGDGDRDCVWGGDGNSDDAWLTPGFDNKNPAPTRIPAWDTAHCGGNGSIEGFH